jgi:hypothetical protein
MEGGKAALLSIHTEVLFFAGLASQQWGRKSSAAKSVVVLTEEGGSGLLSAQAQTLADYLLQVCCSPFKSYQWQGCSPDDVFEEMKNPDLMSSTHAEF